MTEALVFLAASLCLLGFLYLWFHRKTAAGGRTEADLDVSATLAGVNLELPNELLAQRIFAHGDLDFIMREDEGLREQFLRERKAIALLWLRQLHEAVRGIMNVHRTAVRGNVALSPKVEVRLGAAFCAFVFVCRIAEYVIWLRGPFASRGVVSQVFRAVNRVANIAGEARSVLDSEVLDKAKGG